MTLTQFEPKSIKIGIPHDDYSAMQGPCPDGFHIPTKDEWVSIRGIFSAFGIQDGTTFGTYLKMPRAGYRYYPNSNVNGSGDYGYYWACTASTAPKSYCLMFHQYSIFQQYEDYRADGFNIRGFKDNSVTPDSSWTTIYQGSGSAGIFWSSTLGLISLSSNGTTWITIADKNLGATTVYNYGDTLAEANCGKYYQWGNNYGFSFSGYLGNTSSSQVDASNYGPGNYYNSDTFIYSNQNRSSVSSNNLRGGVTGMVQKADTDIKKVYLGSTQVRPKVYPYLCFTANTGGSTVQLTTVGSPTSVTLETSSDGESWSNYTIGNTITLSNVGDKVYFRNSSTTDTLFSVGDTNRYNFTMSGSISGSGNISYLLNKNGTDSLSAYCFYDLFNGCSSLTTSPELPISNLAERCYGQMFYGCTSLTTLPKLPATSLTTYGYMYMFYGCSKIKLSTTQTGEYQTPYRIPSEGTGTTGTNSLYRMFYNTGGTHTGDVTINTTYYTSNTVV